MGRTHRPGALFDGGDSRTAAALKLGEHRDGGVLYAAPSGPAGPQVFQPTGGAFKSMPSPKVSASASASASTPSLPLFDFSQSAKEVISPLDVDPFSLPLESSRKLEHELFDVHVLPSS